jgi:hypothetical protein
MHVTSLYISKILIMELLYECNKISRKHLMRLQGNILTRQKRRTETLLGVVMLAMHDINKYISSTCSYLSYSFMIEFAFEFCW